MPGARNLVRRAVLTPSPARPAPPAPARPLGAVLALSKAAKAGGFYHNTGEGGMSRFHLEGGGDLVWNVGCVVGTRGRGREWGWGVGGG